MKKLLIVLSLTFSSIIYSQSNDELRHEIDVIKSDISNMKSDIQSVKTQNLYLKKSLAINTPILEKKFIV